MKKVIRRGVYETNSSTSHSCTIMSADTYKKWGNDNYLFTGGKYEIGNYEDEAYKPVPGQLYTKDEVIELLLHNKYIEPKDLEFNEDDDDDFNELAYEFEFRTLETFERDYEIDSTFYTTPGGEKIVAVCAYGYN